MGSVLASQPGTIAKEGNSMELTTFRYANDSGFSVPELPKLDSSQTAVFVFGAAGSDQHAKAIEALANAYPSSHLIGCSTAGEIFGTQLWDDSLAVAVARFERTEVRLASAQVQSAPDSFEAGRTIAGQLSGPDLKAVFVLSDGLHVNGSQLVRGLNDSLPAGVVVTGGLAGDGDRFSRTWVLHEGAPASGVVSAVGFYGRDFRIGHGCRGGWDIFGPERTVTRSKDNVLFELDGKPALDLYKTYLGERASGLPATALLFPLALRSGLDDENRLVRTVLAVDEAAQSMTFAGDIPEESLVQLMRANFDRLIEGAGDAGRRSNLPPADGQPTLAIAVSCVGRRLVLGERTEEEIEATFDALPKLSQQVGFYSYGEISPLVGATCDLHNQTMTITTISEA
jgi:hypothetical protein